VKNVFVLEDSKTEAYHLKNLLKKNGYEVIGSAETGAEAIEKVLELKPDLMFADIILKGRMMDGIDTAMEIRKHINMPVIFLTNYSDEHLVDRALKAFPYAYLLKPVNEDQLRVTLETAGNMIRVERESEKLVEQLYQSQKMDAIGQLAGGMAHNYNNILSVMLGNAELVLKGIPADDPNYARVNKIVRAGVRVRNLTIKLLALARKEKTDFKAVSVNEIIEEVLDLLQDTISKKISIQTNVEDNLPPVNADIDQVIQAVLNVCINACDSMSDGGVLCIESERAPLDGTFCGEEAGVATGDYNLIRVRDTGAGIPEHMIGKLFEPFFTTKDKEKGTGLGLYVTQHIIKSHNGLIDIESKEGRGTTVSIFLPATETSARQAEMKPAVKTARVGNEMILIVDDEEDFLDMVSEMMTVSGYRTLVASGGRKAVELYRKNHDNIDLVLLDIMMPEMDGGEALLEMKKISPEVKVVLCSGFSDKVKVDEIMKKGVAAFVQKPFVFSELENVVTSILRA